MKASTSKSPVAPTKAPKTASASAATQSPQAKASKPVAKAPDKKVAVASPAKLAPVPPAPVAAAVVQDSGSSANSLPLRSPRPSSRLAQLTVPSLPPAVASTAAKASFNQSAPAAVMIAPPLVAVKKDPKLANNWKTKTVQELTDPEVMAMADSEYMNEKQTAYFRMKLVVLKQDMLNNAGETTEHLREDTIVVPDPADRATIEEEHALELRTRDRERKLLKKIEQSIQRIDAGDYGYCDETGEPIGVGRLLARPTATLSLEAQQRRELKQKMFGD